MRAGKPASRAPDGFVRGVDKHAGVAVEHGTDAQVALDIDQNTIDDRSVGSETLLAWLV